MSETSERSRSPRTGQFQKGQSGNPKGRPRKQAALPDATRSAFEIVIEKRVKVTQGGVDQELSLEEALQRRTYHDALAGNRAARRVVLKMIAKREKAIADRGPRIMTSVTRKIEPTEPRNADAAMCLLGIAAPDKVREEDNPGAILLEPWAVQAALGRRRGSKALTTQNVGEIKRCTRAPETLRWPRGTIT
jgi:Family of unknown function (DUF5681)